METRISIDLNCDIGESFGPYVLGNDQDLLANVSSANIACGFHAGDPQTMRETVQFATRAKVAIGAHPGLPDRVAFGRRRWEISPQEAYDLVLYQIGAIEGFVRAAQGRLCHVKPHGALYNMAAQDGPLARAIAQAVCDFDPQLILYGLAQSRLIDAGNSIGLRVANEAFADRTYEDDGSLTPRQISTGVIHDPTQAVRQAVSIVRDGVVISREGKRVQLAADTICLHGDRRDAVAFAQAIRQALAAEGVIVQSLG